MVGAVVAASLGLAVPGASASTPRHSSGVGDALGPAALEVNGNAWDSLFMDAPVPGRLRQAGIGLVRWPGGSYADGYDWETNQPGDNVSFADFMNQIGKAGAAPFITVNYGQTSLGPSVAAAWVKNARGYSGYSDATALWEVGNESYGPWETDTHPAPHTAASYAQYALPYFEAMHAADPSAQVGFPYALTIGQSAGTGTWVADPAAWNSEILRRDGSQINFADIHWYPVFGNPALTPAEIMATVRKIPAVMRSVRGTLDRYDPKAFIVVGESNISQSAIVSNEQPIAALYAAGTALEFLSQGARSYGWWALQGWAGNNLDQDFGMLSAAGQGSGPVTTALSAPAAAGTGNLDVASTSGLTVGHTITIGTGASVESREVTAVGGSTTLAAPATSGGRDIEVGDVAPFAAGTQITIGSGTHAQRDTVSSAGTGASSTLLVAPTRPGQRDIHVLGAGLGGQNTPVFMPPGFAPGATVTIGSGPGAETATVKSVGTSSSLATTTVTGTAPGATRIHVATTADTSTGVAFYVGDPIVIGTGASLETDTVTSVGTTGADGTGITLARPLAMAHAAGAAVQDAGTGITLTRPLTVAHSAGATVSTPGTGLVLSRPLAAAEAAGAPAASTGITVAPSVQRSLPVGTVVEDPGTTEPSVDTPMPAYYGYELASLLTSPGARLVSLSSGSASVFAFGSVSSGRAAVLLINANDARPQVVRLGGVDDPSVVTTFTYSLEHPDIVRGTAEGATLGRGLLLPPESIEVLTAPALGGHLTLTPASPAIRFGAVPNQK
jgi:hypothetical protein